MTDDIELELEDEDVEVETPIARAPKEPTSKFGWCLSAEHELCPQTNGAAVCHCPCENHGSSYVKSEDGMSESLQTIAARYL